MGVSRCGRVGVSDAIAVVNVSSRPDAQLNLTTFPKCHADLSQKPKTKSPNQPPLLFFPIIQTSAPTPPCPPTTRSSPPSTRHQSVDLAPILHPGQPPDPPTLFHPRSPLDPYPTPVTAFDEATFYRKEWDPEQGEHFYTGDTEVPMRMFEFMLSTSSPVVRVKSPAPPVFPALTSQTDTLARSALPPRRHRPRRPAQIAPRDRAHITNRSRRQAWGGASARGSLWGCSRCEEEARIRGVRRAGEGGGGEWRMKAGRRGPR